jgi:hypothetical protein
MTPSASLQLKRYPEGGQPRGLRARLVIAKLRI